MRKYIFSFVIACNILAKVSAQEEDNNIVLMSWEIAVPTNDFITETSLAGGRVEYRHLLNDNVSVGGALSWVSFEQLIKQQTYKSQDGYTAVTTDMDRFVYVLPMTVNMHYYFDGISIIKPYVGLNLGAQYSEQTIYYNIFSSDDENWGLVLRPDAGIIFDLDASVAPFVSVGYNFSTNKNESFKINNLQHVAFNVGLAFVFE